MKLGTVLILLFFPVSVWAQWDNPRVEGRDGLTAEWTAYSYEKHVDKDSAEYVQGFGAMNLIYGLNGDFDLMVGLDGSEKARVQDSNGCEISHTSGGGVAALKWGFIGQDSDDLAAAMIVSARRTPDLSDTIWGLGATIENEVFTNIVFCFFTEWTRVRDEGENKDGYDARVALEHSVTNELTLVGEYLGSFNNYGTESHFEGIGFKYLLTKNAQLQFSAGFESLGVENGRSLTAGFVFSL